MQEIKGLQPAYSPSATEALTLVDLRAGANFSLTDGITTRFDTYMANSSVWHDEDQETFTDSSPTPLSTPTPLHPAEPLVELLDTMRKAFAGFISENFGARPSFGFNTIGPEPVEVLPLLQTTMRVVELLDTISDLLSDGSLPSIAYRSVATSASTHLKGFLLSMREVDFIDGLNTSDTQPVMAHCLGIEKTMAAHVQQLQLMRAGVSTGNEG